jgi:serine/threonine protein kinase
MAACEYDYTILNILGEGGHGTVYLAQQEPTRRLVALKILRQGADTVDRMQRLRACRDRLLTLAHPAAAGVVDIGVLPEGRHFVVTEHVRGMPIDRYVEQSQCDRVLRKQLIASVADLLDHAHPAGLAHGSLKPSNILVRAAGSLPTVKATDFGFRCAEPADDLAALEALATTLL